METHARPPVLPFARFARNVTKKYEQFLKKWLTFDNSKCIMYT